MAEKKDIEEIRQHLEQNDKKDSINTDKSAEKKGKNQNVKGHSHNSHRNLELSKELSSKKTQKQIEFPKVVDSSQDVSVMHDKKLSKISDKVSDNLSKDTNIKDTNEDRCEDKVGKNLEIKEEVYEVEVVEYLHIPHIPKFHSARKNVKSKGKGKRKFPLSFAAGVILIVVFFLGFANALATLANEGTLSSPSTLIRDRTQTVSGIVRSSEGEPIEGVQVTVLEGSMCDVTDMEGWFVIKGISLGKHKVKAELPGYKTVTKEIELSNAYPRTVDFVLEPGDGYEYIPLEEKSSTNNLEGQSVTSAGIMLTFSFFGIGGAALSMMRKYYQFAIFLSALSTLSIGFIFGSVLALTALVLIFAARSEFPMDRRKIVDETEETETEQMKDKMIDDNQEIKDTSIRSMMPEMQNEIKSNVNIQKEDNKDSNEDKEKETELTTLGSCNICTHEIVSTESVFTCKCGTVLHKSCLKRVGICPDCKRRYAQKKDVEKMKADLNKINKAD